MTFDELGLNARMVARLAKLGLSAPTPIQAQAIPPALQGRDLLGVAQTGAGKTAAFGIPLVVSLSRRPERPAPRAARGLILAPTRELADQIAASLQGLTADLRIAAVVGGRSINVQAQKLSRGVDILVATPGRLVDLMDREAADLAPTRFLVLDEADQMLDLGFLPALRRIAGALGAPRQTMLFSATMPDAIAALADDFLDDPVRIEASRPGRVADRIDHAVHFVAEERKPALLVDLLRAHRDDQALVFARTRTGAERLTTRLAQAGFAAVSIHGDKTQGQRDRALQAFREGDARVLVATDVAARGIDVPDIGHVYNYDLPTAPETYVHRVGRTARAGRAGRAVAFCSAAEMAELKAIERLLGLRVAIAGGRPWSVDDADAEARPSARRRPARPSRGRQARAAA